MSKGLEAIRQYKQVTCQHCQYHYGGECNNKDECFSMIVEKELEALEIIKKKKVSIHAWYYNDCSKIPYEIYKQSIMAETISSELLTQEEYELLKEVLK